MKKKVKITLFAALLLMGCVNVEAQENNPEFELIYSQSQSQDSLYEFNNVWETKNGDFVVYFTMGAKSYGYKNRQSNNGDTRGRSVGLLKVSKDGIPLEQLYFNDENCKTSGSFFVETESHGDFAISAMEVEKSDQAMIRFDKIDNDFEIISTERIYRTIDTTPDYTNVSNRRFFVYDAFEGDDGIWACAFKRVPYNPPTPGVLGDDSLLFFRFNYDGTLVDIKSFELRGYGNDGAFWTYNAIDTDETGYSIVTGAETYTSEGRFTWLKFDRNFNFIKEHYQKASNPYMFDYGNISMKTISSGEALLSSNMYDYSITPHEQSISIVKIDTLFRCKQKVSKTYSSSFEMKLPVSFGSVHFVNENRIFWGYNDGVDFGAYPYWIDDTWVNLLLMTSDLEIEQEYMYDIKGSNSYTTGIVMKATRDGGLILIGDYSDFVNHPERVEGFITKFPPEAFLSIEDAHANGLKTAIAYPNPGNNTLNIRTSLKDAVVEVYDIQGRMIYNQDITENITSVSTESWNSGMYLWRVVKEGKECESGKWMKE